MNKLEIPEGYRLLRRGSKIVAGDKFCHVYDITNPNGCWSACNTSVGHKTVLVNTDDINDLNANKYIVITARSKRIRKTNSVTNKINNNINLTDKNITDFICIRSNASNLGNKSFYLHSKYNWALGKDNLGFLCLVPTEKN